MQRTNLGTGFRLRNKNGFFHEMKVNKVLYLMLLPGLAAFLINNYLPMIGVIIPFQKLDYRKGIFRGDWVGFKNFEYYFKSDYAFQTTRNTLLYNLVFIFLGLIISVGLAIAVNELRGKYKAKIYQSIMFLPYFMSWIVISYLVYAFLGNQYGMVNGLLKSSGMQPVSWYTQAKFWPFFLVFINLWKYSGYSCVVYLASITNIDSEYYDAAAIDGATKWEQIKYITIPLLQPVMVIMTLLAVGRIFNADIGLFYAVPMDSGALYPVTNVIDTFVYRTMTSTAGDIPMAAAVGLYQSVVGFVCVLVTNFIVRKIDPDKALF